MLEILIKPGNLFKAGFSYLEASVTGKADLKGMPVSVSTELTNTCNLNCPQCFTGSGLMTRKRGFMDFDLYKKVMKELGPYLYNTNLYFQGEPMLHPQFFSFIDIPRTVNSVVSTNGHFLSEENSEKLVRSPLNRLIVSLDGIDQNTYSTYRVNGNITDVTEGLKNLAIAKKEHKSFLKIEIQFLVNSINEIQIEQVRQFAKSVNALLRLKSMQIINKTEIGSWLPSGRRFSRYRMKEGEYVSKNRLPNRCARLWFNPVITWDGKVVPCCFDKNAEYVMGDLNNESFREIWDGPKFRIFRKSILSGRHMIEMCRDCTSGLRGVSI
ncbi:MAG TPA: radical SAM/SPASM domain-containing protein [Bacteroidales bacterium]